MNYSEYNPYKTPVSSLTTSGSAEDFQAYWVEGKHFVMLRNQVEMPHRCIHCNTSVSEPMKTRKRYWHHPVIYIILFMSPLLYIIIALIARKKVMIKPAICKLHLQKRENKLMWGIGFFFLSMLFIWFGFYGLNYSYSLSIVCVIVGVVFIIVANRGVKIAKIVGDKVYYNGCGIEFLNSLRRK